MNWIQLALTLREIWERLKLDASDWTVVVSGISIVMGTLILLIIVFYLFGFIVSHIVDASQKRAAKKAEKKKTKNNEQVKDNGAVTSAPAPVISKPEMNVQQGINEEIVAAISAAVYSIEGSNSKIVSIKRKNPVTGRNPWAQAAVTDNTKPF